MWSSALDSDVDRIFGFLAKASRFLLSQLDSRGSVVSNKLVVGLLLVRLFFGCFVVAVAVPPLL